MLGLHILQHLRTRIPGIPRHCHRKTDPERSIRNPHHAVGVRRERLEPLSGGLQSSHHRPIPVRHVRRHGVLGFALGFSEEQRRAECLTGIPASEGRSRAHREPQATQRHQGHHGHCAAFPGQRLPDMGRHTVELWEKTNTTIYSGAQSGRGQHPPSRSCSVAFECQRHPDCLLGDDIKKDASFYRAGC